MVCFGRSLLTGVEASAAQNAPVTKTCSQCGAVLPSSVRASTFRVEGSSFEQRVHSKIPSSHSLSAAALRVAREEDSVPRWRGELEERVDAYRSRHGRPLRSAEQSELPFHEGPQDPRHG